MCFENWLAWLIVYSSLIARIRPAVTFPHDSGACPLVRLMVLITVESLGFTIGSGLLPQRLPSSCKSECWLSAGVRFTLYPNHKE